MGTEHTGAGTPPLQSGSYMFDSHAAYKRLHEGGYTKKQAEAQVSLWVDIINSNLATKTDILSLRTDMAGIEASLKTDILSLRTDMAGIEASLKTDILSLRNDMAGIEANLKTDMAQIESNLKTDIANNITRVEVSIEQLRKETKTDLKMMESRLIIRLGTLIVSGVGILAVLMKIL